MLLAPLTVSLLLLNAIRFSPESVPAQGAQETLVTVERTGRVVLTASSATANACTLVDSLRGPIQSHSSESGQCELDALLDAGTYKVRVRSRAEDPGRISFQATPYAELNARPVRLEPGREVSQRLAPRQQASFWIHLEERRSISVRVSGRTAGDVRLWRNGQWLEPELPRGVTPSLRPGQPIHEQWLEKELDSGDYLLTVYGTSPTRWTEGTEDDTVTVAYGFPEPRAPRLFSVTVPASGVATVALPHESTAVFLTREGTTRVASGVELYPLSEDGLRRTSTSREAECHIAASARVPQCTAQVTSLSRHVALLRGEPGTRLTLQWAKLAGRRTPYASPEGEEPPPESEEGSQDGEEEQASEEAPPAPEQPRLDWVVLGDVAPGVYSEDLLAPQFTVPQSGEYLVGLHEIPIDVDSAPLGCLLEEAKGPEWLPVAHDLPAIDAEHPFRRSFNYDGRVAMVRFEVKRAGKYLLETGGERKNRCELFHFNGRGLEQLTATEPYAETCSETEELTPGLYELRLYGGLEGIEQLTLADAERPPTEDSPPHATCLMPRVKLRERVTYRFTTNRSVGGSLRSFLLRSLPLTLTEPLPVVLDGATSRELRVAEGVPVEALGPRSETFTCAREGSRAQAEEGHCRPAGSGGTVTLAHAGDSSTTVWLHRPVPAVEEKPLSPYSPELKPLTALKASAPQWFDFVRGQQRAFTFEVEEPGLYHATTLGLLDTECSLRTAVLSRIEDVAEGGRGRNCLVSSFLRPGRYLLNVRTQGLSQGRAGIRIERREPQRAEAPGGEGEVFFRASAGDLLQQRLTVPESGKYTLSTSAQKASLKCRLDDAQGWPLLAVPTSCSQTLDLAPGSLLWTQLPLTVESMRRTVFERVRPPEVLGGEAVHALRLDTRYRARLGPDGQDTFRFEVPAPLTVSFTLSRGIQGRLYALGEEGEPRPVEVIPAEPDRYSSGDEASVPSGGTSVRLAPGRYQLVAEHYLGDVAIDYELYLRSDVLVPPATWRANAPGRLPLRVPVDGTLRLATRGDTDVRCRVLDADGRPVAENADRGVDWNCAIAEPLSAGDYTLVLEGQSGEAGATRVSVEMAPVTEAGPLASGGTLDVGAAVVRASLPSVPADALQEVALRAPEPFSCALEDARGGVVSRQVDVRECAMLLRPGPSAWKLRIWTVGKPLRVSTSVASRSIRPLAGGRIREGQGASVRVPSPGRYATGPGLFCLPESQHGLLRPCGPEASLEAGAWVFGTLGAKGDTALALSERVDTLDAPREEPARLERSVTMLRQHSPEDMLHLLRVEVPFGEPSYPACRIDAGVARQRDFACFAATGPTRESLARWWTPTATPGAGTVTRLAVPTPSSSMLLLPGVHDVRWSGGPSVRLALPAGEPVKLSLPPEAWAVQVDRGGVAVDVCAPTGALSQCLLRGGGDAVLVWSPLESRVQVEVLALDSLPRDSLESLFEGVYRTPGQQRLSFSQAGEARRLSVVGAGARCVVTLDDGTRLEGCDVKVPAQPGGEVLVDVQAGGLRAVLAPPSEQALAALALPHRAPSAPELPPSHAFRLSGSYVEWSLTVHEDTLVHIRSESGVCGLRQEDTVLALEGLGEGCSIARMLKAGRYRLVVRAFAGQPLTGTLVWTQEPVQALSEGIAPEESWVTPGQTRLFRFTTTAAGRVGLGVQVPAELLECTVLDAEQRVLGTGCQQFLSLEQGTYLLSVHAPHTARPLSFKPVLVGLAGTRSDVPEEYLRDLFQRIGATP